MAAGACNERPLVHDFLYYDPPAARAQLVGDEALRTDVCRGGCEMPVERGACQGRMTIQRIAPPWLARLAVVVLSESVDCTHFEAST